jgi:hypothetical protein
MVNKLIIEKNGNRVVELEGAELQEHNANLLIEQKRVQDELDAKEAKIQAEISGNQKLLNLGLTQAEATALTGYKPPVVLPDNPKE